MVVAHGVPMVDRMVINRAEAPARAIRRITLGEAETNLDVDPVAAQRVAI
ncbi:hypothetical protein PsB1_1196 [Candidatus Phycosocius spiralis]|uniref:Uncharacterized protein n=1 Tax=Candidatus Phycosocius spiralis TaxID=2815099 RepID=A0ABQ4PVI8_9PROT|nr:hypothetical protein PsB1_1196 [Candidatus Phycosocius spiralis]